MWDNWGREAIEDYIVALAQYLRARIVDIWGEQSLSLAYTTPSMPPAGTGLTSFNPFSPGFDYNAELSVAESQQQRSDSSAAVATLRDEHRIVIRNNSVPHTLRSDPMQNAAPGTFSSPLRISTHLFHSTADVDRVIRALQQVVPMLAAARRRPRPVNRPSLTSGPAWTKKPWIRMSQPEAQPTGDSALRWVSSFRFPAPSD